MKLAKRYVLYQSVRLLSWKFVREFDTEEAALNYADETVSDWAFDGDGKYYKVEVVYGKEKLADYL